MDILSHGLWGALPFYKRPRFKSWLGFLFGAIPDLFAFAPHIMLVIVGLSIDPLQRGFHEPLTEEGIHPLVFNLYNISHSFVVFGLAFLLITLMRRKPLWEMLAWGFHILADIPTHTGSFFPTPFLWPLSDYRFDGFSWGQWWFVLMNYSLLMAMFIFLRIRRKKIEPIMVKSAN